MGLGEAGPAPNYTQDLVAPVVGGLTGGLSDAPPAGVKSDPSLFCFEPLLASCAGKIIMSPHQGQSQGSVQTSCWAYEPALASQLGSVWALLPSTSTSLTPWRAPFVVGTPRANGFCNCF